MLAYASRKNKGGGSIQQPLNYLDPSEPVPNAPSGSDLLARQGLIVRPALERQAGGGSIQQPLQYLDPTLPAPSASPGQNLLVRDGLVVRPVIERQQGGSKGGFLPSVMKGVVNSAVIVGPLASLAAHRMLNSTRKRKSGGSIVGSSHSTTSGSRGGGKKENWAHNREAAKEELSLYGKPSALNINKYAALKRKNVEEAENWLTEYIVRKRKTAKKGKKTNENKTEKAKKKANVETVELWGDLLARAKVNLEKFGKPSGPNVTKFASIKRKGLNAEAFLTNYKTRKHYKSPEKTKKNEYLNNLQAARKFLSQYGKPTVANVAKFVSQKRKGVSTVAVENAVKARAKPAKVQLKPPALKFTAPVLPHKAKPDWATAYNKAKANLIAIKAKPKAYQIATLASMRRKGENNSKYLELYRGEK